MKTKVNRKEEFMFKQERRADSFRFSYFVMLMFVIAFLSSVAFAQESAKFCFRGTACRGAEICEAQTCVDFSGTTSTEIVSCSSCGTTSAICRDGSASSCSNACQETALGAQCTTCNALNQCGAAPSGRQHNVLSLLVFDITTVQVAIIPETADFPQAQPASYEVMVNNPLPVDVLLQFAVSAPSGWDTEIIPEAQIRAGATQTFPLTVRPVSGITGSHKISVAAVNTRLKIASIASAQYNIISGGLAKLAANPSSFKGTPDQKATFAVTVTDTNPATFPSTAYTLEAKAPAGWTSKLSSRAFLMRPGENRQLSLEVTPNTTPETFQQIELKLAAGNTTTSAFIPYTITLCGDSICQPGEETSCQLDCPLTEIKCSGRCESELDWGMKFKASLDTLSTRFIVCRRGSSPAECDQAFTAGNCGTGRACICGSSLGTECDVRCVDLKGVYYMTAKTIGKNVVSANYSYACPFVNLNELVDMRDDFLKAKTEYEKSRAALRETITRTANATERAKYQPCSSGLELIIDNITDFTKLLNGVIEFPGKQNTTLARAKAAEMQLFIDNAFSTYCKTTLGILRIDSIEPPGQTEVGKKATARVSVKNVGNVNYYGYVECDFIGPAGRPEREKTSCTLVPQGAANAFPLSHDINATGDWKLKCRIIGSLKSDCSSEVHDESALLSFNAYSKEIFVQDVVATEGRAGILCSVRTSRSAQCVSCALGRNECTKVRQAGETTTFECPTAAGNVQVTGSVFATADCAPVEPKNKTASASIAGCGDGVKADTEECEVGQGTCVQESFRCDEATNKYGTRSEIGSCSNQCKCVASEQFTYKCVADKCGATCSDGEERPAESGCVLKCSNTCGWVKQCSAEFFFDPEKSTGVSAGGRPVEYKGILKNAADADTFTLTPTNARVLVDSAEASAISLEAGSQKEIVVRVEPTSREDGATEQSFLEIKNSKGSARKAEFVTIISSLTNAPPYMSNIAHSPASASIGSQITFYADVTDPEGDAFTAIACGDAECSQVLCALAFAGPSGSCIYLAETPGEREYYIRAGDNYGFSVSAPRTFTVEQPVQLRTLDNEPKTTTAGTEASTIFSLAAAALLVVAAGLAYYFRDSLKEKMAKVRVWWNYRFG